MVSADEVTAPVKEGEILAAKYRVEKVIGVGGMGVVVAAMHLELEQRVALKFLLPQAAQSDELVGRFLREAKSTVKLKGAHVAKVLDVGRLEDGRAFIVMEYLEGRDLGAELKAHDEPFAIADAVSWMLQACEGLAEAHALGIIHRDLKPGNLFLTRGPDGRTLVKVLDFGISKSINPNASDLLSLTKTEMLLGSPLYMAPEQMRSSKHVDERSDIWALGAIAYELLARRVPFEADTLLDLCFKVAQEGCPDLADLRPDIPEELGRTVMRCLQKEANDRWNDIGELAAALEPFARPADRGSAERTIAILAAGFDNARARRSDAPPRAPKEAAPDKPISTASKSKRQSSLGANRTLESAPVLVSADPLVSGTEATARVESLSTDPPLTESTQGTVPASSAWGTTNASVLGTKNKNRRNLLLISLAPVAALTFILLTRPSTTSSPPPPTPKNAIASVPVPVPESLSDPPSATPPPSTPPPPPPSALPPSSRPLPRPKASTSSAPPPASAPKPSSDFIRERE